MPAPGSLTVLIVLCNIDHLYAFFCYYFFSFLPSHSKPGYQCQHNVKKTKKTKKPNPNKQNISLELGFFHRNMERQAVWEAKSRERKINVWLLLYLSSLSGYWAVLFSYEKLLPSASSFYILLRYECSFSVFTEFHRCFPAEHSTATSLWDCGARAPPECCPRPCEEFVSS